MLDLDLKRTERQKARAATVAGQEIRGEKLPIFIDGEVIAELGPELSLAIWEPLRTIIPDLTLVARTAMEMWQANERGDADTRDRSISLIIDMLVSNDELPTTVLEVLAGIGKGLLGEQGYVKFMAAEPSIQDVVALLTGLADWYGVSLGESSGPSESPVTGGPNSKEISEPSSADSTPETPSAPPAIPASSESAAS